MIEDGPLPCMFLLHRGLCGREALPPATRHLAHFGSGVASGGELPKYRVPLCAEHEGKLTSIVLESHRLEVEYAHQSLNAHQDYLRRLSAIKGSVSPAGKSWRYRFSIPPRNVGIDQRRIVAKAGFRSKREAQQALKVALLDLRREAGESVSKVERELAAERLRRTTAHETVKEQRAAQIDGDRREARLTRREKERPRSVYYVQRPDGAVKIGTTWNIRSRMQALRNVSPVTLLAAHSGGQPAEAAMHRQFAAHRLDGEWFSPHPDLLAHIERVARVTAERQPDDQSAAA